MEDRGEAWFTDEKQTLLNEKLNLSIIEKKQLLCLIKSSFTSNISLYLIIY